MQALRSSLFIGYGLLHFTKGAYSKHAKAFRPADLDVDLSGQHCIITGGNSGIGKAAAEALAARGATVHLVCRNRDRGEEAVKEIVGKTGNEKVDVAVVDVSSMAQVREYAASYSQTGQPLHVLVNNAGVMEHERKLTADGLELNLATNILGVVVLTELLLPVLERSTPSKVITVSSGGMLSEPLEVEDLQSEKIRKFDGTLVYAKNKRQQVALTEKWAEIYSSSKGVGFFTMHPGWVDTPVLRASMPGFYKTMKDRLRATEEGADTIVWLATQPLDKLQSGQFYFDREVAAKHLPACGTKYSDEANNKLYGKVKELGGLAS